MVLERLLGAGTVGKDLPLRFAREPREPELAEPLGIAQLRREETDGGEAGQLSDQVVVGGARAATGRVA